MVIKNEYFVHVFSLFERIYHFFFLKNSNFVRTRDTFRPIANDKCVVMLRAWQITPVFSVSFNFKDRSYFFSPPSMNHCIELRRRRLIRAVRYWKCFVCFFEKEKKFRSRWRPERGLIITSCVVLPRKKATVSSATESYENKSNISREKRLIEYGRTISRD